VDPSLGECLSSDRDEFMTFYVRSKQKFGAKRMTNDGYSFASKLESALYDHLKLLQGAGEIENIRVQDHVKLTRAGIKYIPDFRVYDKKLGCDVWHEAKGFETPEWRLKRRLWMYYGPGRLTVWVGSASRLAIKEILTVEEL